MARSRTSIRTLLDAARTLGWSNAKIFFKLMLPLSWSSIAAGTVLSFARALGEFGATLFLAGNYLGITRTIPIAIYFEWMNGNTDVAIFWTVVIMAFSFVVILFINLWSRRTTSYRRGMESVMGPVILSAQRAARSRGIPRGASPRALGRNCRNESEVNIRKSFSSFTLDVAFEAGDETLGFLGASGCGEEPYHAMHRRHREPRDEGRIVVNDRVFFDSERKINLTPQQRKTALLFQSYMLFPNLTVAENVAAGIGREASKADRDALVAAELKRFGLEGFDRRYPAQLSGGQQQRVALARMLAARPGILMLDEPFSALDAHLKSVLEQNLVSLFDAFHGTVLYVSHDIDEALRFCDRIAVVETGRITETGTGDDLVNRPQSLAGVKLSGCKNATAAVRVDERSVRLPKWGIEAATSAAVPEDVKALGVRAFFLQRVDGPGENCYRVRVDRVSDSRFERTVLLGFLDRDESEAPTVSRTDDEMEVSAPAPVLARRQVGRARRRAAARGRGAVDPHSSQQGVPGIALETPSRAGNGGEERLGDPRSNALRPCIQRAPILSRYCAMR